MGAQTSIEWAANADGTPGATWNPIRARDRATGKVGTHCVRVSEGCRHCYAERHNLRGMTPGGSGLAYTKQAEARVDIFLDDFMLRSPLQRRKPTTYFLSSMTDVFADFVPDAMLDQLFAVMALTPRHTFIVLTKRADRMRDALQAVKRPGLPERVAGVIARMLIAGEITAAQADAAHRLPVTCLPNVWLVVSAEDQATADERIPHLLATPAAVRGVSYEPALGSVDYTLIACGEMHFVNALTGEMSIRGGATPGKTEGNMLGVSRMLDCNHNRIDWVICGGESGPGARPMHPDWARSMRDQCAAAGVPFFFKQWGEHLPVAIAPDEGAAIYDDTTPEGMCRRLDGRPHVSAAGGQAFARVGKRNAGRLLDGVEHNGRPDISQKGEAELLAMTASPGGPVE